ncbi:MAG TPA: hypothetical protein VF530_07640 [Planctomycetota bacterium]
MSPFFTRAVLLLGVLAGAPRADVLTVGPAGSGAQFTEIQAAIDAARNDDVILVRAGTYASFQVEKPLRILRDGAGTVSVSGRFRAALVRGIPAGEELVLSGLSMSAELPKVTVLAVERCPGTVLLHDLDLTGVDQVALGLEGTGRTVLLHSRVFGGVPGTGLLPETVESGAAIDVAVTELWIADSEVRGMDGRSSWTMRGAHGIEARRSVVRVWKTRVFGGAGSVRSGTGTSALGGTGILVAEGNLELLGGPGSEVRGGNGVYDPFLLVNHAGGPGVSLEARYPGSAQGSTATIQATLPIQGGFDGLSRVQAPNVLVDAASSFTLSSQVLPTLAPAAGRVAPGSSVALLLTGNRGALQVLHASLRTGPISRLRGVGGVGWLDPNGLSTLASVILPGTGSSRLALMIPRRPALLGSTLYLQTVELFAGRYAIGNPALVVITN